MPDAHESLWKHMEQETPDELICFQPHFFESVVVLTISIFKSDLVLFCVDDAMIGDSNTVGIATKIVEYLFGTGKGGF